MVTASLTLNKTITLEPSDEDRDKYGRLLRYVFGTDGLDIGGQLLAQGYATPRYSSTDGYGLHPREDGTHQLLSRRQWSAHRLRQFQHQPRHLL